MLIGEHDFSAFRGSGCTAKHPLRRVLRVSLEHSPENNDVINFEIEGQAFLKHMVRNIVGTLVSVGQGKIDLNDFKNILESKDRTKAGVNAPAQGLFMVEVKY
jgi:tRNA pseudouridine38-40 synthase